jgi:hypothetical protein
MASLAMPTSMRNMLYLCEAIFHSNVIYRSGCDRVISYFNSPIEVVGFDDAMDDDDRTKYTSFFAEKHDLRMTLQDADRDFLAYGNSFLTPLAPFMRFLTCPKCGFTVPLKKIIEDRDLFRLDWKYADVAFNVRCPNSECKNHQRSAKWLVYDKPDDLERNLTLKRWNVHEIEILHDEYSERCDYLWRIPPDYRQAVMAGRENRLLNAPMGVLDAISKNAFYRFKPGMMYHMKESTLAGIRNRGWGIPRSMTNFRQVWYIQVLQRFNEAIALDYVIPFRVITPAPRGGTAGLDNENLGPLELMSGADVSGQIRAMIRQRRRDPASWFTLPFPVQYSVMGGEANQLVPSDLLDQGIDTLLNGAMIPVDFYKGSLTTQAAPQALRTLEANWYLLVHHNNSMLRWYGDIVAKVLRWKPALVRQKPITRADDLERQTLVLQLAMSQAVSMTTALEMLGLSFKEEQVRLGNEVREQATQQEKLQKQIEALGLADLIAKGLPGLPPQGGMPPQGGAAPPPGGQAGAGGAPPGATPPMLGSKDIQSPQDLEAAAQSEAERIVRIPDATARRSELAGLREKNQTLHSLVTSRMKEIRQQADSAGGDMLLQQSAPPQ